MTYADLMVNLSAGRSNDAVLRVAAKLAVLFHSGVIGMVACRPIEVVCGDYILPARVFEEDRRQIDKELLEAEGEFRATMGKEIARLQWRQHVTTATLAPYLARAARAADLVIVAAPEPGRTIDPTRHVDVTDLLMEIGRPVLLVPQGGSPPAFERIMIGWKEGREAQRAIVDALPFLASAKAVSIVAVAREDELADARLQLADVASWLGHRGINAEVIALPAHGTHADALRAAAIDLKADLIVAGAYGYSRHRELMLGGVTSDLLLSQDRCALLSH